jgi:cyanate permease
MQTDKLSNSPIARTKQEGKIYFGWWIVAAVSTLCAVVQGFTSSALTVIFKPLASELGFTRAVTSGAASVATLQGGLEAPLSGWLVDKFGPKWVMFAGITFIGTGLFLMNYIHSVWQYYLVWGVLIASGNNLALTIPIDKIITNWFIKKRGIALGIKFASIGVGAIIVVPIITWITANYGWRMTCQTWAIVAFLSLLLIIFFIRQKRPEHYGLLPDGARSETSEAGTDVVSKGIEYASQVQETEFTLRQAMKTRAFWLILIASGSAGTVQVAVNLHIIPFLTDKGISTTMAGLMLSLLNLSTIPARLFGGIIADRLKKGYLPYLLASMYLTQAIAIAAVFLVPGISSIYVFLILFGLGSGAATPVFVLIRGRYFGRKAYGSISGISSMIIAPLGIISPIWTGWVYDATGSYSIAFWAFAAIAIFSVILAILVRPPKAPPLVTDTNKFM